MGPYEWYKLQERTIYNKHVWKIGARVAAGLTLTGIVALVVWLTSRNLDGMSSFVLVVIGGVSNSITEYIGREMEKRRHML